METPLSLHLLYTANLRGDIAILPRLFTLMQRLKTARTGATLILDLGKTCDVAAWHCRATGGRSMLVALDGMGYHAANVAGALDAADRGKLAEQVTMALVDELHPWSYQLPAQARSIRVLLRPDDPSAPWQIQLSPAERSEIIGNVLCLREVRGGQLGSLHLELSDPPRILQSAIHDLPPDVPPNPTIAGAVEFVEAEARLFQRKQSASR